MPTPVLLRNLFRTPLVTSVAIVSLALGIGANTAIFSILNQLLLRTLPVHNPEELAFIYSDGPWQGTMSSNEPGGPSFSYPLFRELQKTQTPFAGLAGSATQQVALSYKNAASHGSALFVSGNYFELLGTGSAMGRLFTEDDDRTPGAHPVAILGYNYWAARFGADVSLLNQTILVNDFPMTIVGVTQEGFISERLGAPPDIYVPVSMVDAVVPESKVIPDRRNAWLTMFGRRKPGVTMEQAQTQLNIAYQPQLQIDVANLHSPDSNFIAQFKARTITLKPGEYGRGTLRDGVRPSLLLVFGMTLLVLLIACANVANLQLARSAARAKEVAVRLAIGASRAHLIRKFLAESCALALAGGVLSLLVAYWTQALLINLPSSRIRGMQNVISTNLDWRVLLFCLGLSILTGLLFGIFPALQSSKPDVITTLKDQAGQTTSTRSANVFRKALVAAQIAISLVLLISGGLFARSLVNLTHVDLGIRTDHLITFNLLPKLNRYTDERIAQLHEQLLDKLAAIPGVTMVSTSRVPAVAGSLTRDGFTLEGLPHSDEEHSSTDSNSVGADYFRTMGIPLLAGREFTAADNTAAPSVAIVNEAFVKEFLPNLSVLGRYIAPGAGPNTMPNIEIVGIVKDAVYSSVRQPMRAAYYFPIAQSRRWNAINFYLRTAIPPENTAPIIQRAVADLDATLPIRGLKTMQTQLVENTSNEQGLSLVAGIFATLATLLAAIGLYGVLAYNITRRTREIGIRMALGAASGQVRGLVGREVALVLIAGTTLGLASAAASGQVLQSFLFGLKPWDVPIYSAATLLLWLVALAAAYLPARRATNVDPMIALRYE